MKIKRLFPFSIAEYMKVLAYYAVFMVVFYLMINLIIQRSKAVQFIDMATTEQSAFAAYSLLGFVFAMLGIIFVVYTFFNSAIYSSVLRKRFSLMLWPKFMLSSLMLFIIFVIPALFVLRLLSEGSPASPVAFFIIFLIMVHFSNLVYLFTASERKVFSGIKKGFEFGTLKIRKLAIPYVIIAVLLIIFSFIMRPIPLDFLNVIISLLVIAWALLFVGRTIFPLKKISRRRT